MSDYQHLQLERNDQVALVRFNRPKVMNALCAELMDELAQVFIDLDNDDSVGAIRARRVRRRGEESVHRPAGPRGPGRRERGVQEEGEATDASAHAGVERLTT